MKFDKLLIFGGTGSLGKTLIKKYCFKYDIINFSRDELKQWDLRNMINSMNTNRQFTNVIGNIRDYSSVKRCILTYKPDLIIIASALKQIVRCEQQPDQSILTNLLGIQNVIKATRGFTQHKIHICFVSTDKVCNPINTYGLCKALSEKLIITESENSLHKFVVVRYGNVLNSRGSIIPFLEGKCQRKEILTITTKDMTRFIMSLDQCVELIDFALFGGYNGETIIPILPSMSILYLFELFSEKYGLDVKEIGIRIGEKIHETLVNNYEYMRSKKIKHNNIEYHVIQPYYKHVIHNVYDKDNEYTSNDLVMNKEELRVALKNLIGLEI